MLKSTISEETLLPFQLTWRIFGVCPLPSTYRRRDRWLYTVYSVTIHTIFALIFNVCLLLALLNANNIDDVIEICLPASSTCMSGIKMFVFIWKRNSLPTFIGLIRTIESLSNGKSASEFQLIRSAQRKTRYVVLSLCAATTIVLLCLITVWSLATERQLLWPAWYPFDWQTNTVNFVAAMIYQILATVFIAMFLLFMDNWRTAAFFLLLAYLQILNRRLRKLGVGQIENNVDRLAEIDELKECIGYHHLCLQLFKTVEELCDVYYLAQFANSVFIVCVTAYLLAELNPVENSSLFFFYTTYLFACCLQLLIPCVFGTLLSNECDQLSVNLYKSNWIAMTPSFKSSMRIMMERTKSPTILYTYKGLFVISLQTFVQVIKSAYSMSSFLRGME